MTNEPEMPSHDRQSEAISRWKGALACKPIWGSKGGEVSGYAGRRNRQWRGVIVRRGYGRPRGWGDLGERCHSQLYDEVDTERVKPAAGAREVKGPIEREEAVQARETAVVVGPDPA